MSTPKFTADAKIRGSHEFREFVIFVPTYKLCAKKTFYTRPAFRLRKKTDVV